MGFIWFLEMVIFSTRSILGSDASPGGAFAPIIGGGAWLVQQPSQGNLSGLHATIPG
jgi:hypothetical protein